MTSFVDASDRAVITNYFDSPDAARRYAAHRPRGQSTVLALLESVIDDELPVNRALDAGCGTGHSTVALLPFARRIVGLDPSSAMLAEALLHPNIEYRKGHAEAMPFRAADFDLLTVSSAYHWFDHERFLAEASRVLRDRGWLILYKAGSTGRLANSPAFDAWRRDILKARYPRVARNSEPLTAERAASHAFTEHACESRTHSHRHTLAGYVENLLTHSSIIRTVGEGHEPIAETRAWLAAELARFFPGGEAEFVHETRIHVLRRNPR